MGKHKGILNQINVSLSTLQTRVILVSVLIYVVVFVVLYEPIGTAVSSLVIIPVGLTGWFLGIKGGIISAFLGLLLNVVLVTLFGYADWDIFIRKGGLGMIIVLIVGVVLGRLHDLSERLKDELSERKRVEEALRENEERYRSTIESMKDLILFIDNEGVIRDYYQPVGDKLYAAPEIFLGRKFEEIFPPEMTNPLADAIERLSHGDQSREFEYYIELEGETFWYNVIITGRYEASGDFTGVTAVIRDITEHKQAEEALWESEVRFQKSFESTVSGSAIVNEKGEILRTNQAIEKMLGYTEDELRNMSFPEITFPDDLDKNLKLFNEMVAGKRDSYRMEKRYLRKDGSVLWGDLMVSAIRARNGNFQYCFVIIADITERKQTEVQLKKSEEKYRILSEQLTEANNMKELLLDIITHDLKNPVGVIHGISDMLSEENPEDEKVHLIKDSCNNLLQVIKNTSVLARVALDEEIKKEQIDLAEVIEETVVEFAPLISNAGMTLEYRHEKKLPVWANPIIAEVFKNFISNAIKYAAEGKKIIIETDRTNEFITVSVKDLGSTIPNEDYRHIFKRGVQQKDKAHQGRGLGLAIVKRIAELHGGDIWVTPNKPKGNIFYLKIPGSQS